MVPSPDPYLEARKAEILNAARAVFVRHGFERATMQDIATEVGISPGAIYRYFPSKEDLITVVCAATGAESMRPFEELKDGHSALELLFEGGREVEVVARTDEGAERPFRARVRIDTPQEIHYVRHGGILQYVLRRLART